MEEEVLHITDGIYHWPRPKRKSTLFSATLGRLGLTTHRLMFLSSGKHDVTAGKLLAGAAGQVTTGLRTSDTTNLDISALGNKGSLEVPLQDVRSCELKGMFKVLVVNYVSGGSEAASTFAPKNGGMSAGKAWIEAMTTARAQLGA